MFYRIVNILGGLLSLWVGFRMYRDKMEHHYGFPVPPETGLLLCIVGIILIYFGIFTKKGIHMREDNILMCLSCQKPIRSENAVELICPLCQGKLEELEGFYDRHPELRR